MILKKIGCKKTAGLGNPRCVFFRAPSEHVFSSHSLNFLLNTLQQAIPKTVSLHSFSPPPATPYSTGACPPGGASDRGSATGGAWREDLVGPSLSLACVRRGSRS
ncbi:hypothetical protein NPIL_371111 [Nephila pilipes]|uniref:Uncharacterized protein n=1 Tax=Nephila pilipes TaxID=299642 RepID=A0A8X6NJE2_NEPPI|nr:hypothetical protein NPIL_371111 [Nephila pilipes]